VVEDLLDCFFPMPAMRNGLPLVEIMLVLIVGTSLVAP